MDGVFMVLFSLFVAVGSVMYLVYKIGQDYKEPKAQVECEDGVFYSFDEIKARTAGHLKRITQ